ncbi:MAG: hypothetical protein RLZZ167_467 [Pseudomonadota bacterium]|jgi:hypothetical protein
MNEDQIELLKLKAKDLENAYNQTFGTLEGKKVLNDLQRNLLINGDVLAREYTQDDILASHLQVGLKIAYKYIENILSIKIINNQN